LPVGSEIFIPETLYNLEVAVHAGHHQDLFKSLWGLREGIKLALVDTAGHHKIPCAFRSTLDEVWRLYFDKAGTGQILPGLEGYPCAEDQFFLHRVSADIEIPVFHAEFIAAVDATIESISNWPQTGSPVDGITDGPEVRRAPVDGFPTRWPTRSPARRSR